MKGKGKSQKGKRSGKQTKERRVVNVTKSTGFPDSELAVIRYSDEIGITGATYGQYTFRGNSCFDPDDTGIGHQPMYFDQYAAVYSRYKVLSCTCRVSTTNYNAAASAIVVLVPSSEVITITSYSVAMEQPYAVRTELLPVSTRMGAQSTVRVAMSTQRILGLSNQQLASEDYSALTTATPLSVWYWNIAAFDVSAVSVRCAVDLEYKVLFYDRKAPTLSLQKVVKSPKEQAGREADEEPPLVLNFVQTMNPEPVEPVKPVRGVSRTPRTQK